MSGCYIFEYHNRFVRQDAGGIPVRVFGWVRTFTSTTKDCETNKRYLQPDTLHSVQAVAKPNLEHCGSGFVNGLCYEISELDLGVIDRRRGKLRRVLLEPEVVAEYEGYELKDLPVYVYVAEPSFVEKMVCPSGILNFAQEGARYQAKHIEGFHGDWLRSTRLPECAISDLLAVHISADGKHLWLSEDGKGYMTMLIEFVDQQFSPKLEVSDVIEFKKHPDKMTRHLDFRNTYEEEKFERRANWGKFLKARDALLELHEQLRLLNNPCWLVRLALANNLLIADETLDILTRDSDMWVSRCAKLRQASVRRKKDVEALEA